MDKLIWYSIPSPVNYEKVEGVSMIDGANCSLYEEQIQQSIDLFNSEIEWDDMWTLDRAYERFESGYKLFLLRLDDKPLGHIWNDGHMFINVYVSKNRPDGLSEKFFKYAQFLSGEPSIELYTDEWNKRAQRFFEKVGGTIFKF